MYSIQYFISQSAWHFENKISILTPFFQVFRKPSLKMKGANIEFQSLFTNFTFSPSKRPFRLIINKLQRLIEFAPCKANSTQFNPILSN
jgi:hypothetical protein